MKRLLLLGIVAAFVLGLAAVASAADIKATGEWYIDADWIGGHNLANRDDGTQSMDTAYPLSGRNSKSGAACAPSSSSSRTRT